MTEITQTLGWPDVVGVLGAIITLAAYFATQMRWLNSDDLLFPAINLTGSLLIGYSLLHHFNLASAVMECAWLTISLIGIWQCLRRAQKPEMSKKDSS